MVKLIDNLENRKSSVDKKVLLKSASLCVLSIITAACGGGSTGGGGTTTPPTTQTPPPTPTPPPPPPGPTPIAYDTAEYRENPSLAQMNAQAAYLNGITGDGILVAVIDSGVSQAPEMQGQLHSRVNVVPGASSEIDDLNGHGTGMASIIAARRDHSSNTHFANMHGIAFNAQILSINAASSANCDADDCSFFNSNIASGYNHAVANNVDVINESLGSDSPPTATLVAAMQAAVAADIVIVLPAGNRETPSDPVSATESAAQLSASSAYAPWANDQIIIAGSVDSDNTISDFSYRAGTDAQNVFLMAPGRNITGQLPDLTTPEDDYAYYNITGTSASTAQISGAAALLREAFPSLTARQVVTLLLDTATDLGAPGPDPIYGRGLIDLEEAFSSQGMLTIAGTGFGAGLQVGTEDNVSQNNLVFSGGAFGADIGFSSALNNIMVLDKFDRSYHIDFSQSVYQQQAAASLEAFMNHGITSRQQNVRLSDSMTMKLGWRHDDRFLEVDKHLYANHLGIERKAGDLRMSLSYNLDDDQTARVSSGMSLVEMMEDYRPDDYMAPNKHGYSSLLTPSGTQAVAYKNRVGKKTSVESAYASSQYSFGEEMFSQRIDVKSALFMSRISHQATRNLSLAVDFGMLSEDGSVLGAVSRGAVEIGRGASTGFVGTKIDYHFSNKSQFFARATYGLTTVDQSGVSLLGDVSTLKSYSYLVGVKSHGLLFDNDQISFTFSQPLKLDGGFATVSHVTDRNYDTGLFTMSNDRISLNPSGTERDFELSYALSNVYGARVQLNLLHQRNPGHISTIDSATSVLLRLGSSF